MVAPGLLNRDQLPAGKFASGDEASAVAPRHLGAKRSSLTSPPKMKTGLMVANLPPIESCPGHMLSAWYKS